MKYISLLVILFSIGCAHKSQRVTIAVGEMDGLRFESLKRYNNNRLESIKNGKKDIAMCHKGMYNQALNKFKTTLDSKQNNPKYWNKIATCYLLKEELPKAKFYYDLALKTAGKNKKMNAIIKNNLGLYFNLLNKDHEAMASFKESMKLNSKLLTPKYNMAKILLRFGHYSKAKTILTKLYKKAPKDIDFTASLGHLNLMTGKYKRSIWYYTQLPQKFLAKDNYATNLAMAYVMDGRYKKAEVTLNNAERSSSYYSITQTKILKRIDNEKK